MIERSLGLPEILESILSGLCRLLELKGKKLPQLPLLRSGLGKEVTPRVESCVMLSKTEYLIDAKAHCIMENSSEVRHRNVEV